MFINRQFMKWDVTPEGISMQDKSLFDRPWSLYDRAEKKLATDTSPDSRGEFFITLKRAIDRRLKGIEQIHEFTKLSLPIKIKSKSRLELLEYLGIVRPLLIKKLMTIRNDIEHHDMRPPSMTICQQFLDTTWYFLKSTDFLVIRRVSDLVFEKYDGKGNETAYGVSVNLDDLKYERIETRGWVPSKYVRKTSSDPKFSKLENCKIEKKANSRRKNDGVLLESDLYVSGNLKLDSGKRLELIRLVLRQSA